MRRKEIVSIKMREKDGHSGGAVGGRSESIGGRKTAQRKMKRSEKREEVRGTEVYHRAKQRREKEKGDFVYTKSPFVME